MFVAGLIELASVFARPVSTCVCLGNSLFGLICMICCPVLHESSGHGIARICNSINRKNSAVENSLAPHTFYVSSRDFRCIRTHVVAYYYKEAYNFRNSC